MLKQNNLLIELSDLGILFPECTELDFYQGKLQAITHVYLDSGHVVGSHSANLASQAQVTSLKPIYNNIMPSVPMVTNGIIVGSWSW